QQAEDLALVDLQRDIVDCDKVAEFLGDVLDLDIRLGVGVAPGFDLVLVVALFRHALLRRGPRKKARRLERRALLIYLPVLKRCQTRVSSLVYAALSGRSGTSLTISS